MAWAHLCKQKANTSKQTKNKKGKGRREKERQAHLIPEPDDLAEHDLRLLVALLARAAVLGPLALELDLEAEQVAC